MIKVIIIDDEPASINVLSNMLRDYCEDVEVIATAGSLAEGIEVLLKNQPDMVFLDISFPDGEGFSILEKIPDKQFEVVFITAHDKYAVRAFDFAALHYLTKPFDPPKVVEAIKRYNKKHISPQQFQILDEGLDGKFDRLVVPSIEGFKMIDISDIVCFEADRNCTLIHLFDKTKLAVTNKSLLYYGELLEEVFFFRTHDKYLVNLRQVASYQRGKTGTVVFKNGEHAYVSERKQKPFLTLLKKLGGGK